MNEEKKIEIGKRIEDIRLTKAKMNKRDFSKILNMQEQNLGKIERGIVGLSMDKLIGMHDEFKISTDYILFGEEICREEAEIKEVIASILINYKGEKLTIAMEIVKAILDKLNSKN